MKTFKQIREFNIASDEFLKAKPENEHTKLGYAIKRVSDVSIAKILKDYQGEYQEAYYEKVQKVHIDQALTDKTTGAILTAPAGSDRPYLNSKEGLKIIMESEMSFKKYWDSQLEEWDKKEFEIIPYIAVEIPDDLSDSQKESLAGFVIPE